MNWIKKEIALPYIHDLDLRSRHHRFLIVPDYVVSIRDNDRHWIGANQLMSLYRVPRFQCVILDQRRTPTGALGLEGFIEHYHPDKIVLMPSYVGNYDLPPEAKERKR